MSLLGIVRGGVRGLVLLAVVLAAGRFVALAFLDQSATARALIWLAPDSKDQEKFATRGIDASYRPLPLPTPKSPEPLLTELAIDGLPLDGFLASHDSTAFLVSRGETLIFEKYYNESAREHPQASFLLALAFTSTLVGQAVAEGLVDPDDTITAHLPEFGQDDPRLQNLTIRHLLTMASGLGYRARNLPWSDDAEAYYSPDLRQTAMAAPYVTPPGEKYHFNLLNPLLLGMVLERATGMEVTGYLQDRLWQPMGAEGAASWSLDSQEAGFERMHSGLNARAVDILKLGILLAQEGRIGRRVILDPAWVAEATRADTSLDPSPQYQFYWWVFPETGRFGAIGDYGQMLYIDPESDLVALRMGHGTGDLDRMEWVAALDQVLDALKP